MPHPTDFTRKPIAGAGIGLRSQHVAQILSEQPAVPWFEILTDNHFATGGIIPTQLQAIRTSYPLTMHSVGMSLGSVDPLNWDYIKQIKQLAEEFEASWISEHICFTSFSNQYSHDLLPLPYTEEALGHLVDRICQVQEFLGQRILMENASRYVSYTHSTISEGEFVAAMAQRADCDLLLDVNNAYVNQFNHDVSVQQLLKDLPLERVREVHLAGFEDRGRFLLDAHNNPISAPVLELYRQTMALIPDTPTLIEWDNDIPELEVLMAEAQRAENAAQQASKGQHL